MDPGQAEAIRFVQRIVPPGEKLYVGVTTHDRVLTGDLMFYFLAARHSAVKYHEMIPRLTNTLPVQQQMVEELKKERVKCIVLYSGFDGIRESNASSESSGVTYLDDFIGANFKPIQRFGDYTVLVGDACRHEVHGPLVSN
jgi:hypothetical protein